MALIDSLLTIVFVCECGGCRCKLSKSVDTDDT